MRTIAALLVAAAVALGQEDGENPEDRNMGGGGCTALTQCDACCNGDRPSSLTLRYVPGAGFVNSQGDRAGSSGTLPTSGTTFTFPDYGVSVFLNPGESVTLTPGRFEANTDVTFAGGSIFFHTSCSRPLNAGDAFGVLVVTAFVDPTGRTQGPGCGDPPPGLCVERRTDCSTTTTAAPTGTCGCDRSGLTTEISRPSTIEFLYSGGAPTGSLTNFQNGKGGSTGGTLSCAAATISCVDKDGDPLTVSGSPTTAIGDAFTVSGISDSEMTCTVTCSGTTPQTISIHTSCSAELFTGQDFGAITVSDFPGQCNNPPPPAPTPCVLCCISGPDLTNPPERLVIPKDFCETCDNGVLNPIARAQLDAWIDSAGGMVCDTTVPGGRVEYAPSLDADAVETALCADPDFCPDIEVSFTCREACPDFMDSEIPVGDDTITRVAEFQIGFVDQADCPANPTLPSLNACGCDAPVGQTISRPSAVELVYTGGAVVGGLQNNKGGSTGATVTCAVANIQCRNNKDTGSVFFTGNVNLNSAFTVTTGGITELECTVTCGGQGTQVVDIHTSCSQPLFTGQDFGALVVGNFPGQCNLPPPSPPPPCPLCCVDMPEQVAPPDEEFPKVEDCTSGNELPTETKNLVAVWINTLQCNLRSSVACDPDQQIQAVVNGVVIGTWSSDLPESVLDFVERMVCLAEDNMYTSGPAPAPDQCPEVVFRFSCCDPCNADDDPFTSLDPTTLCVVDQATIAIVDREDPVLVDADSETHECDLTELTALDTRYKEWRNQVTCTDAQSPGQIWSRNDNFPRSTVERTGQFGGDLFTSTPPAIGPVDDLTCQNNVARYSRDIRWTCTDECDNSVAADISFNVRDTNPPDIFQPALDISATCSDFQLTLTTWLADNGGARARDCFDFVWTVDPSGVTDLSEFDGSCPWTKTFTFTATDQCNGKSSSTTATFTATDTEPPRISCPGGNANCNSVEAECGDDAAIYDFVNNNGGLECNDDCGMAYFLPPQMVNEFTFPPGTDGCPHIKTYEFTCKDMCGNTAMRRLNLTIVDTQPPEIVVNPADTTVECDGSANINDRSLFERMWAPGLTGGKRWANDDCNPNPTCGPDYRSSGYCSFCVSTYDPVCCHGTTYPNSCYSYCNGCTQFYPGTCNAPPTMPPPTTPPPSTRSPTRPPSHAPVTESPTYPPTNTPPPYDSCGHCSSDYTPVCIGGNKQYDNMCYAYCHGYYHFTYGTCYDANDVDNYGHLTCQQQCGQWSGKVCGANGVTYDSPCKAACDDIYVYHAGPCGEQCGMNPLNYTFTILPPQTQFPGECQIDPYVFTATDECNNDVSAGANFAIIDTTPPQMTPALDVTVDCDGSPTAVPQQDPRFVDWLVRQGGATATDLCAGHIPVPADLVQVNPPSGWQVPVMDGTEMPAIMSPWTTNGPMGRCETDSVTDRCVYVLFRVKDNCGNDGVVPGGHNPSPPGGPSVTIGTVAKFVVVDRGSPTLVVKEITTDFCFEGHQYQNKAVRWANCQDNVPVQTGGTPPPPCPFLGPQAVLNAHDTCEIPLVTTNFPGLTSLPQIISRPDALDPQFTVKPPFVPAGWIGLAPSELPHDVYALLQQRGVRLGDKCPRVSIIDISISDALSQGERQQAYHIYVDNTPPVFSTLPEDLTVECQKNSAENTRAFNYWLDSNANSVCHDDCTLFGPVTSGIVGYRPTLPDLSRNCPGPISVKFFCEDFCGNRVEATATFTVTDTIAPTITVHPDERTVECGPTRKVQRQFQDFVTESEANAIVSDNCCVANRVSATVDPLVPSPGFPQGCSNQEGTAALTVRDKCDNYASTEISFFVRDTLPPVFITPGVDLRYPCDPSCTNANEIARLLFEMWIDGNVNGCLEAEDCQEDMSWMTSGAPSGSGLDNLCGTSGSVTFTVTDACGNANATTLEYEFPDGPAPPTPGPPPPCTCDNINGRPSQVELVVEGGAPIGLTLQSNKGGSIGDFIPTDCPSISVTCGRNGRNQPFVVTPSTVQIGGSFIVQTQEEAETECILTCTSTGARQTIDVHTSCSQDLFTGQDFGAVRVGSFPGECGSFQPPPPAPPRECPTDFLNDVDVCDCIPVPAPPPPPGPAQDICDNGRPSVLSAEYIGGSQMVNQQGDRAELSGGSPSGPATITCQGQQVATNLPIGGTFVINTNRETNTDCTVIDSFGVRQDIRFHTSCSRPLNTGDIYGSIRLLCQGANCAPTNGGGGGGGFIGCPPPPTPPSPPPLIPCGCGGSGNNQLNGRPDSVALEVVAGGPIGLSLQNNKGGSTGSPIPANCPSVTVECHNNKQVSEVFLGHTITTLGSQVVARPAGNTEMECTVACPATGALQTIDIHTSCSQPLFAGQNFGALRVISFPGQCGNSPVFAPVFAPVFSPISPPPPNFFPPGPPPPICNACEGVSNRVWEEDYYDTGIQAKQSGGGGSKPKLTSVTVRYIGGFALTNNQEGKASVSPATAASGVAVVQCEGVTQQMTPGGGELTFPVSGAESVCTVTSAGGTQVIEIHTSCSKDINVGDIYGSLVITRLVRNDGVVIGESQFCPTPGAPTPPPTPPPVAPTDPPTYPQPPTAPPSIRNPPTPYSPTGCRYDSACQSMSVNGGKLTMLRFRFVTTNAGYWSHGQTGWNKGIWNPYLGPSYDKVRVKVGGKNPKTWQLRDGEVFEIKASDLLLNRLPNKLNILIGKGQDKAKLRISTQCRYDLRVGDVFGVLEVVGYATTRDTCSAQSYRTLAAVQPTTVSASAGSNGSGAAAVAAIAVGAVIVAVLVIGVYRVSNSPSHHGMMDKGSSAASSEHGVRPADLAWDMSETREPTSLRAARLAKRNTQEIADRA